MTTWSKKTYETVAAAINDTSKAAAGLEFSPDGLMACRLIAGTLADSFAGDNALFDRARFLEACGTPENKGAILARSFIAQQERKRKEAAQ